MRFVVVKVVRGFGSDNGELRFGVGFDPYVGEIRTRSLFWVGRTEMSYDAEYYRKNRERRKRESRLYYARNRDRVKSRIHRRRHGGQNGEWTMEEFEALCHEAGDRCVRCGCEGPLTPDHILPLALGGSNEISNIQPLCVDCNRWKGVRHIDFCGGTAGGGVEGEQEELPF